jgi:hypothetical protein
VSAQAAQKAAWFVVISCVRLHEFDKVAPLDFARRP